MQAGEGDKVRVSDRNRRCSYPFVMFKRKRDEPGPGSWECPVCTYVNDPSAAAQLPNQKEHECCICSASRGKINATFGHHDNRSEDSVSSTRTVGTSTISSADEC